MGADPLGLGAGLGLLSKRTHVFEISVFVELFLAKVVAIRQLRQGGAMQTALRMSRPCANVSPF
jgi:hypothetical protein